MTLHSGNVQLTFSLDELKKLVEEDLLEDFIETLFSMVSEEQYEEEYEEEEPVDFCFNDYLDEEAAVTEADCQIDEIYENVFKNTKGG